MKQKNRLTSRLYIIATIAFYGTVVFAAYLIFCDMFIKPTDSFFTVPNHNYGYTVPVSIQLNKPGDSTMAYHTSDHNKSGVITTAKHYSTEDRKMFNEILNDTTYSKTIAIDSLTMHGGHKIINDQFDNISFLSTNGYAILNPKNMGTKLLLAVKDYLYLFALLYALWLTRSFFKSLKNDFSFNRTASRKLHIIGNVILCYQVINWILCLIITQFYWHIRVESVTSEVHRTEMYSLTPSMEFNFGLVILSLSLIVISKLFDKGYHLQQENELTI